MLTRKLIQILFIGALSASVASTALATDTVVPFGSPAGDAVAQRTVKLLPETKFINVVQGEIIKFTYNGKSFTWNFDTLNTNAFDLFAIAPKDMNITKVRVHLSPNPTYSGGN